MKQYHNYKSLLVSGQDIIFLPKNPNEFCNRLCLITQEKEFEKECDKSDQQKAAVFDKSLGIKCFTVNHHKKLLNFDLI